MELGDPVIVVAFESVVQVWNSADDCKFRPGESSKGVKAQLIEALGCDAQYDLA
jgi:hypothetical protein